MGVLYRIVTRKLYQGILTCVNRLNRNYTRSVASALPGKQRKLYQGIYFCSTSHQQAYQGTGKGTTRVNGKTT
eukprot:5542061-Pleurochrysis_carterae.AAC.1